MFGPYTHRWLLPSALQSPAALHRRLTLFNRRRLQPRLPGPYWRGELQDTLDHTFIERQWLEEERQTIAQQARCVPTQSDAFLQWFQRLAESGPGQGDPLFPWLATQADREQMRWFLTQEVAGEAGFDDLVALTQVGMPTQAKLELACNYWDEMGRGKAGGMHGPLLNLVVQELALTPSLETTVWESLALSNTMVALAANREYAFHAIGALGVVELTAPGRVSQVNEGLVRLGVSAQGRRYFQLHTTIDIRHSMMWNQEVIQPLVARDPRCAYAIAEGALLRLQCGARCFARYRAELGLATTVGNS